MRDLAGCLEELYALIEKWGGQIDAWSAVGIAEETALKRVGVGLQEVCYISHSVLCMSEDYAPHFDALLQRGYSWLNMNAAGIVNETLIVIIELPNYVTEIVGKTSVNYSGPGIIGGKAQWDATDRIFLQ